METFIMFKKISFKKILGVSALVLFSSIALSNNVFGMKEKDITDSEYSDLGSDKKSNCVLFARYKTPSLPSNLRTYEDKIQNAKNREATEVPSQGWIAIENTDSKWGHVAWVKSASKDGDTITVTTHDGNWSNGKQKNRIYERTGTTSELKIKGYYAP